MSIPHMFCTSKLELFDLMNPKIPTWQIPSLHIIPNPKWTKRAKKIPNQSSSWPWNCRIHTFERCCLQVLWVGLHQFGLLEPKSCNPPQITQNTCVIFSENQKSNATIQTPIQKLHFIMILLSPHICTFWEPAQFAQACWKFSALQIRTFGPEEPKNSNLTFSFLVHYPQPKLNQNSPKDPKLMLISTMKQVYTYFW